MNKSFALHSTACALLLLALAGCNTIAERIREKSAVFDQLDGELRQNIRDGHIGIGYTPDMVYMALGKPNTVETTADGKVTTWTYLNFNTPDGEFLLNARTAIATVTNPQEEEPPRVNTPGFSDPMRSVAGEADLRRGEVRIPDSRVRPITAEEMITGNYRQDLQVRFFDGFVAGFDVVRVQ